MIRTLEPGQEVTNGHWAVKDDKGDGVELLSMTVLAVDGEEVWVRVNNGLNQGQRLTFSAINLRTLS